MTRLACVVVLALFAGVCLGLGQAPADEVRFASIDLILDVGDDELAAYQVDLRAIDGDVTIVGIGGGDGVFSEPPYYDPIAMRGGRVVIGAFDIGNELPKGRVRIASVEVRITGDAEPQYLIDVMTAATSDGSRIDATASAIEQGA